jgi:GNAT superfamily N-acetyltransferase
MTRTSRPTIEIREATREDADAICDAHVAAWREGYRHVFSAALLWGDDFDSTRRDRWRRWEFTGERFAAVVDGRVVGFAHIGPERDRPDVEGEHPQGRGEVYGFYLHPDVWGSGAALELMAAAERRLVELGYTEAVLWVLEDNPRGRAFYDKTGWRPTGARVMFDSYCDEPVPEVEYRRVLAGGESS